MKPNTESNKIYKMNIAEGIFFPAFDRHLCDDSQITMDKGTIERTWDCLTFQGGAHYTVHWQGKVILGTYDTFLAFMGVTTGAAVTATGIIDGKETQLVSGRQGEEDPIELKGSFPAHREDSILTDIFLTLDSPKPVNVISLSWLGLSCSALEEEAESRVPRWQESWEDEITKGAAGTLDRNLLFTEEEGARMKALVSGDEKLRAFFRANAESGMEIDPRACMREYAPNGDYRFVRVKDRGRKELGDPALELAIAGWLLEEPAYSAQAARLILALTAMKWCEGPICDLEGSKFHHVCFMESHRSTEVVLSMGFLGGILSREARERVTDKVEAAWKVICEKNDEPGYRNFMNQGIVGRQGAMLGAVYLQKERGGHEKDIENVYRSHTALVDQYLNEEGHCVEGGNYFDYSFRESILLWHTYAVYRGKSWKDVVPESFRRAGRYLEAIMSVNNPAGEPIPVNSCGCWISTLLFVFMTLTSDFPEGNNYLMARLENEAAECTGGSLDMLIYLYYKGRINPHPYLRPETEEISMPKSGLLTYRTGSTKLLVSAERNPYTGHFHEDRGGVVLEAEGETLLPDLGTTGYGNSAVLLMVKKAYHNLACPVDLRMLVESEVGMRAAAMAGYPITEELTIEDMAVPEAKVLYHEMTEDGYRFGVETGMLFGEGISGIRQGTLSGRSLCLTDSWQFPEAHPLMVTFLSYSPWEIREEGREAVSGRMTLRAASLADARFEQEEGMVDNQCRPVHILRVMTEAAKEQKVETEVSW